MKKILLTGIICLLMGSIALAEEPVIPNVTIPKVDQKVAVDGRLREEVWKEAEIFKFFFNVMNLEQSSTKTLVFMMYDDLNLYIGFKFYDDDLAGIPSHQRRRDDPVYLDDSIELFVDVENDGADPYFHIVINPDGVVYDEVGMNNPGWNLDFVYQACRVPEEKLWNVEIMIPFKSLGVSAPRPGTVWGLNLARNRYRERRQHTAWALTPIGYHQPTLFGQLYFGN